MRSNRIYLSQEKTARMEQIQAKSRKGCGKSSMLQRSHCRPPRGKLISQPAGTCPSRLIALPYAWLAASLPSAACAAAKRAMGTRNGEHDT
jgi:hypothetical protein